MRPKFHPAIVLLTPLLIVLVPFGLIHLFPSETLAIVPRPFGGGVLGILMGLMIKEFLHYADNYRSPLARNSFAQEYRRYPEPRDRRAVALSVVVLVGSLLVAAFAQTVWQFMGLVTIGVALHAAIRLTLGTEELRHNTLPSFLKTRATPR